MASPSPGVGGFRSGIISVFRAIVEHFTNDDFDKLVLFLGNPLVKNLIYSTNVNFTAILGNILSKTLYKKIPANLQGE